MKEAIGLSAPGEPKWSILDIMRNIPLYIHRAMCYARIYRFYKRAASRLTPRGFTDFMREQGYSKTFALVRGGYQLTFHKEGEITVAVKYIED